MKKFPWFELKTEFSIRCMSLINLCQGKGLVIEPSLGFRSLQDQATLWKSGRSMDSIEDAIDHLKTVKCDYLALILEKSSLPKIIKKQDDEGNEIDEEPKILTDYLPGFSWHNWGEAMNFHFLDYLNRPRLPTDPFQLDVIAQAAKELKLTPGYYMQPEQPYHVQFSGLNVGETYPPKHVNDHFEAKLKKQSIL